MGMVSAFVVGALLLVLGLYLTFGPLVANQDDSALATTVEPFELPPWFFFPVGIPTVVSWQEMTPPDTVSVQECQSVTDGKCDGAGSVIESGIGPSGSFTFTASEGQLYGINTTAEGVLTIDVQYTGAYGILLFLVYVSGVVCIAMGFVYNHQRGSRYAYI